MGEADVEKIGNNKIFNFGSDSNFSVREIVEKVIKLSHSKVKIKKIEDGRHLEIKTQYSSSNKANKILKWKPKYSTDQGIEETIEWYKNYLGDETQVNI